MSCSISKNIWNMVQTSKADHFGCAHQKGCNLNLLHAMVIKFSGNQQTLLFSLNTLKLEEKSGFNFMKTRFDWERLGIAKYRLFSGFRSSFWCFLCEGEQRRLFFTLITKQKFEKRFRTRLTAHLVHFSGVTLGLGEFLQYFEVLLSVLLPVGIAEKVH